METVKVQGFDVRVRRDDDGGFVMAVDELPGCIATAKRREDIVPNMTRAIGAHLVSLMDKKVRAKRRQDAESARRGQAKGRKA